MSQGTFYRFWRTQILRRTYAQATINSRINILYFLDTLCETCYLVKSHANSVGVSSSSGAISGTQYVDFLSRDLNKLVETVVPEGREGLINYNSAKQVRGRGSVLCLC